MRRAAGEPAAPARSRALPGNAAREDVHPGGASLQAPVERRLDPQNRAAPREPARTKPGRSASRSLLQESATQGLVAWAGAPSAPSVPTGTASARRVPARFFAIRSLATRTASVAFSPYPSARISFAQPALVGAPP